MNVFAVLLLEALIFALFGDWLWVVITLVAAAIATTHFEG